MNTVIEAHRLSKRYRDTVALDNITVAIQHNAITGLLGRNGTGKSTLMSILTAQNFATNGTVRVFGEDPYENANVLSRLCFVRESQKYPEDFKPGMAFAAAALFFENWDQQLADELIAEFRLPMTRPIKKLSRGQLSAVGIIIGIASRAEITFFDEPYLGLDAVARQIFYDRLLADYAEHPRTIVLSSHLIDEVDQMLEHIILLDDGRVRINAPAEELRGQAYTIVGDASTILAFTADREVLHAETLGHTMSATVFGVLSGRDRQHLAASGANTAPVSLQQLIVRLTQHDPAAAPATETAQNVMEDQR